MTKLLEEAVAYNERKDKGAVVIPKAIFTWFCQWCGWGNDNNNTGFCKNCEKEKTDEELK